jgi:hypothetical protein
MHSELKTYASVWVEYLRGTGCIEEMDYLIEKVQIATNELILAQLLSPVLMRHKHELAGLLKEIPTFTLRIDWDEHFRLISEAVPVALYQP